MAIEMYRAVNNFQEETLANFFLRNNHNYNLLPKSELTVPNINNVFKGQTSISYFGSVIWIKGINSFQVFKSEIKALQPTNCPFKVCNNHVENLGFVIIPS